MTSKVFLKVLTLYFLAYGLVHLLAFSSAWAQSPNILLGSKLLKNKKSPVSSWAHQQIETNQAQELAGDHRPVIAIIDTGVDFGSKQHPTEVQTSLWTNTGESGLDSAGRDKASNGVDDDGNGYIDDVHGWNFVNHSAQFSDQHGHGTHIAGIISSVAPQAQQMILKYYDARSSAEENVVHSLQAFRYAIQMHAQIINFSGGGPGSSRQEEALLKLAEENNILLVAAAGNDGVDTDKNPYFPADYKLSNILSVTALNSALKIPEYANFGALSVSVAAPGDNILSTLPNGLSGEMSGTSQATAFVSGVAALLLTQDYFTPSQIIEKIVQSGVKEKALLQKTNNGTRLNAFRSLAMKGNYQSAEGFVFTNSTSMPTSGLIVSHSIQSPVDEVSSSANGGLSSKLAIERNHL